MNLRGGIGWLSSSSAEITRARGVIDALKKPGVIDELGFLMLNGAFAGRFYQGVTTIMTRARYLLFIPALYQHLEQSRNGVGKDVDKLSRDLQFELRNALSKNEEHFIGKDGGRLLIRVPSTVYWGALEDLGIAQRSLSETSYQRSLSEGAFGFLLTSRSVPRHEEAGEIPTGRCDRQQLRRLLFIGLRPNEIQSKGVGQAGSDVGGGHLMALILRLNDAAPRMDGDY